MARKYETDSLFFQFFQTASGILFELVGEPTQIGEYYDFRSEEVKQTAFRIDGVFVPKPNSSEQTIIFTEVQFQNDPYLYDRMFAEIGMYLVRTKGVKNGRASAILERRRYELEDKYRHRDFLRGEQFSGACHFLERKIRSQEISVDILRSYEGFSTRLVFFSESDRLPNFQAFSWRISLEAAVSCLESN